MSTDQPGDYGRWPKQDVAAQKVLNQSWPLQDKGGKHARGIPDQPAEKQLDVTVRLELQHAGEVFVDGVAVRWHGQFVYVHTNDPRVPCPGVWLLARDVRRR